MQLRSPALQKNSMYFIGFGRPAYTTDHSFTYQSASAAYHRQICSTCGYETADVAHDLVQKYNTSSHWLGCALCSFNFSSSSHRLLRNYSTYRHWDECSCGYQTNSTSHSYSISDATHTCTGCDFSAAHNCTSWTSRTATSHTGNCNACGKDMSGTHTFVTSGNQLVCSVCGYASAMINSTPDELG